MKTFAEMGKEELRAACKDYGVKNYGKMNNAGMREALEAASKTALEAVTGEVKEEHLQENIAGVPVKAHTEQAAPASKELAGKSEAKNTGKGIKIEKGREERNGIRRPSVGGKCRAIWDWCDSVILNNGIVDAKTIKAVSEANGWNINNAIIEMYQWKKFNKVE